MNRLKMKTRIGMKRGKRRYGAIRGNHGSRCVEGTDLAAVHRRISWRTNTQFQADAERALAVQGVAPATAPRLAA